MEERKLRTAYRTVEICAVLRLLGSVFLAFSVFSVSGNLHHNLSLLHHGAGFFFPAVVTLAADSLLTLLWPLKPKLFKVHLILFVLLGIYEYVCVIASSIKLYGGYAAIGYIFLGVVLWIINLIIFAIAYNFIKTIIRQKEIQDENEYDADDTAY